ncbi:unnamed protein product [Pocillopora meandrina]|uniref:Uncharacterized protein n=1 Tax=Pocillopora meandrina TaxID=46732 RepID=A0AAU9XIP9_9CNID|nr:unnamed protein product [Pocillopora meandrina]
MTPSVMTLIIPLNNLIDSAQSSYYTTVISDFSGDQRMLFRTVHKLLQKQKVQQYPSCFPDSTRLADAFNNFFISKIDKIHNAFIERAPENDLSSSHTTDRPLCDVQIHNFQQVTLDMVKKFAVKTLTKSCDLDLLPASLIEKAVALQLNDHILRRYLDETFQSAYKAFHST